MANASPQPDAIDSRSTRESKQKEKRIREKKSGLKKRGRR
jgi:hypothetical protein